MKAGQIPHTSKPCGVQLLCFQNKHYFLKKFHTHNSFLEWSEAKAALMYSFDSAQLFLCFYFP